MKPKCKECGKSDKVVKAEYGKGVAQYWECERCFCVVKEIYDLTISPRGTMHIGDKVYHIEDIKEVKN